MNNRCGAFDSIRLRPDNNGWRVHAQEPTPPSLSASAPKIQGVRDDAKDPVATRRWLQRTVRARLFRTRRSQLLAAYRLHNCLVAAEQDRGTVRVRILEPKTLITTVKSALPFSRSAKSPPSPPRRRQPLPRRHLLTNGGG